MTTQKVPLMGRRKFLKTAALAGAGTALAACAPVVSPGAAPVAAPAVNKGAKQTVRYLSWWFEEGNRGKTHLALIKEFNESQKDIEVKAENTPFDAYTTKTIVGAQSLGLDGDVGSIEPGKLADLVVMDRNPLENLRNSNSVRYVMKNGRLYDANTMAEIWPRQRSATEQLTVNGER